MIKSLIAQDNRICFS